MTFTSVSILMEANAFPENTVFVTINPSSVFGNAQAPATKPALNFTATAGATALPLILCANTITLAPNVFAAAATTLAFTCASKWFKFTLFI